MQDAASKHLHEPLSAELARARSAFARQVHSPMGRRQFLTRPAETVPAMRHVLMTQFDKPEARRQVKPVVVAGDHAVAGWAQGERGGQALLQRHHDQWQITVCGGVGLEQAQVLAEAGVPTAQAQALAKSLALAEAKLPAALLAKFSSFDGLVRMDAGGQHTPEHKH
jgi:hypothetical protein